MPKRIIIIRHGETDYNKNKIFQGWDDVPLNKQGLMQAKKVANRLKEEAIDAFYSSDLSRALDTAKEIGKRISLQPTKDKRIRERNLGFFQGKKYGC